MGVLSRHCPYCKTQSVAFTARFDWRAEDGDRSLFTCGSCGEGVIWDHSGYAGGSALSKVGGDLDRTSVTFFQQWPRAQSGTAPEDTPAIVRRFFEQGTSSLTTGSFDAAGMMFRKTLETATKIFDPDSASKRLVDRIDKLRSDGKLTPDMAQWAHEVRLGGNDAAHDDDPFTSSEADDLKSFAENFLTYAFTLPAAVRRRTAKDE